MIPSRPCTRASAPSMSRYFCVRLSSDHTLRMASLLKKSPKIAESMMVDGMVGGLGDAGAGPTRRPLARYPHYSMLTPSFARDVGSERKVRRVVEIGPL